MADSIDSSRRTAGSILSIVTSSSRASDAYQTDAERGERSASRMSRRTMSEGGEKSDYESGSIPKIHQDHVKRKREFKGRHIQMMGIGATIGAGVLLQSGKSLYFAGPISVFIAYLTIATVVYSVLVTLGEMIAFLPLPGGFASLANRVLSPSIGFAVGWIYFFRQVLHTSSIDYSKMLDVPNKLVAAANYMTFWTDSVPPAVWIVIYVIPPIIFNLFNVRRYGEIEFWLTLQKVITFLLLISYGILMAMQASAITPSSGTNSNYEAVPCSATAGNITCVGSPGFNLWREDGMKDLLLGGGWGRLIGFWSVCCQACFAYTGAESVAITASEVERPRQTIPKAVRRIANRLNFYYIGAVFVLGLNLSSIDPILEKSLSDSTVGYHGPFVLMAQRAGIPRFGDFLNVMALGAALSVSNASLYMTSRVLYALAREGQAPKILLKKNNYDVPWVALVVACLPATLAFMSIKVSSKDVFDFLSGMSTTGTLIAWAAICAIYIRFRKAYQVQGIEVVEESKSSLQPFLAWYGLAWTCFLTIFQGFLCFARNSNYWAIYADNWGFSLGPYAAIGGFTLLMCTWLVRARVKEHRWTWQMKPLDRIDLVRGVSPKAISPPVPTQLWRRVLQRVLEYL